ncbi:MAG: hypothetical protein QW520_00610 [Methanomassiliicoccales archaeon]
MDNLNAEKKSAGELSATSQEERSERKGIRAFFKSLRKRSSAKGSK